MRDERLEYDLLFPWFVGIGVDEAAWDHSVFSKNRDRLLEGDIAAKFLATVLAQPQVNRLPGRVANSGGVIGLLLSCQYRKLSNGTTQSVQSDFGRAVQTDRYQACTGADRRIAGHPRMTPHAGAH